MPSSECQTAEINEYWDERAQSYYNGVVGELSDERRGMWEAALETFSGVALTQTSTAGQIDDARGNSGDEAAFGGSAASSGEVPRVLDLGCGPGFFCVLLSQRGCAVDAIDASENMLSCARQNVREHGVAENVAFHQGDVASLPFADSTFDLAVTRNVTWLMRNPQAAYTEWLRVLRPGGKLLVFDANWYRYLVDDRVAQARQADQEHNELEGWDEASQATSDEEKRCERIAEKLPLTPVLRPAWDVKCLAALGASAVASHEDVWKLVWSRSEQSYYGSTPMFLVEVTK